MVPLKKVIFPLILFFLLIGSIVLTLLFYKIPFEKIVGITPPQEKAPVQGPTVTIRDDEILLINGQPFFPIGMYSLAFDDPVYPSNPYQALADAGFNTVVVYDEDFYCSNDFHPLLERGVLCRYRSIPPDGCTSIYDNTEANNLMIFGGRQIFSSRSQSVFDQTFLCSQGRSSFLGFNFDEPIWRYYTNPSDWGSDHLRHDISLAEFQNLYNNIKLQNPNALVWFAEPPAHKVLGEGISSCPPSDPYCFIDDDFNGWVTDMRSYSQATDIYSIHFYPIPNNPCNPGSSYCVFDNPELNVIGDIVDTVRRDVVDYAKPVWVTLQHRTDNNPYAPDLAEKRFMAYESIIHGATGIFFYNTF